MKSASVLVIMVSSLCLFAMQLYCEENKEVSITPYSTAGISKKSSLTPFPNNQMTWKIIKRNKLQHEGDALAEHGRYDEAILKFKASMDSSLLNYDYDKAGGEVGIKRVYIRQGKFEEALQIVEGQIKSLPPHARVINDNIYTGLDELSRERLELHALMKARDTKNNKPIYEYMEHLKTKSKYAKLIPPKGYTVGISTWLINDLIHLYDYLHDYDAGIAFMTEIIKYHTQHKDKNHRSAHEKDVREYTRVKQAWELDKKTGRHGHLKEVIKTSNIISW